MKWRGLPSANRATSFLSNFLLYYPDMKSEEIRTRFLKFFENRGHAIIPSAPLVPLNDPSVLFNIAGMQPMVPYLLGQKHSMGTRIVDSQKCFRTVDIDEVGDNRHCTFFEMLGNWSLGDYFKEDAIKWSYEFLTVKDEGLGLDPSRIYVTVFEGDKDVPRDNEAVEIWKKYMPESHIYYLPAKNNWWALGETGPCGPDTEIFYDINENPLGEMSHEQFVEADDKGKVIEIWNNVFMAYERKDANTVVSLSQKNIDTGMGLERIAMVCQKVSTVFETDVLAETVAIIKSESEKKGTFNYRSAYIITDHLRASAFLLADGATPDNKGRGYVVRRIIRRAMVQADKIGLTKEDLFVVFNFLRSKYESAYPELKNEISFTQFSEELERFSKTLVQGLKEFEKGKDPFVLATTYGFPIEITLEICKEKNIEIDIDAFNQKMAEHQKLSQTASAGMFKGGLANHNEKTIRLHTAHHLLLSALQEVLGKEVKQRGSNITEERLRMDFAFDRKMTDEEKKKVEDLVNENIQRSLTVVRREMKREDAEKLGAEMEFGAKYPDIVSVYFIEDENGNHVSKEFCGGPHVSNTKELGKFKIQKEEASSQGVRRIKAILE